MAWAARTGSGAALGGAAHHRGALSVPTGLAATIFRQPEIQNLGVPALGDKDVGGLDVPVDNALGVRRVNRTRITSS